MKNLVELDDQEAVLVMCALRYYEANHFTADEVDDLVQRINCPGKPMKKWEIQKAFEEGAVLECMLLANHMNPTVGRSWYIFQFGQLNWALYDYRVMS